MVHVAVQAGIATITLRRPHRLNTPTWAVMDELRATITCSADREDVRALIITGAGCAFCAGCDLIDLATVAPRTSRESGCGRYDRVPSDGRSR